MPKDSVKRFLAAQYAQHGIKYINYLFGSKIARLFKDNDINIIDAISTALIVSPTVDQFANVFGMNKMEKQRFTEVLKSLNTGQLDGLPIYIVDSSSEGLALLTEKLINTGFIH